MSNIELLQGKIDEKPIVIRLGKYSDVIKFEDGKPNIYPINPGVVLGEGHYGFVIITEKENKEVKKVYKTSTDLYGIQLDEHNIINIFEDGFLIPWKFDRSGKLIQKAAFNEHLRSELEKAWVTYGITPESNPEFFGPKKR